jgi:hypothetical protein
MAKSKSNEKRKCGMARHMTLADQGVWAEIEKKVNAAYFRRINKSKPIEDWQYPILTASLETMADDCNTSMNTISKHLDKFERLGMLHLKKDQHRLPDGRWSNKVYTVELHDHYALDPPLPTIPSGQTQKGTERDARREAQQLQ